MSYTAKVVRKETNKMNEEKMAEMADKMKEIDQSVGAEFQKFRESMILKSRFDIFNNALIIAFYSAASEYFRNEDDLLEILSDDLITSIHNHRGSIISLLWDEYLTVDYVRFDTNDGFAELLSMTF